MGGSRNVLVPGIFPSQLKGFALLLDELHEILVSLPLQSVMLWMTAQPSEESVTPPSFAV